MNAFADWLFSALLGWTGRAANSAWNAVTNGSGGFGRFFAHAWFPLLLILLAAGTLFDFGIWFFRWRPDRLWRSRKARRRASRSKTAESAENAAEDGTFASPVPLFPAEGAPEYPPVENSPAYPPYPVCAPENAGYAEDGLSPYPSPYVSEPPAYDAVTEVDPGNAAQGDVYPVSLYRDPFFLAEEGLPSGESAEAYAPPFYSPEAPYAASPEQGYFLHDFAPQMYDDNLYRRPVYGEENSVLYMPSENVPPAAELPLEEQPFDGESSEARPHSRRSRAARMAKSGRLKNRLKDFMTTDNSPIDELPPPIDYRDIFPNADNSAAPPKEDA